jgi:hypothetical protein
LTIELGVVTFGEGAFYDLFDILLLFTTYGPIDIIDNLQIIFVFFDDYETIGLLVTI